MTDLDLYLQGYLVHVSCDDLNVTPERCNGK